MTLTSMDEIRRDITEMRRDRSRFIKKLREKREIPLFYSSNSHRGDALPIDDSCIFPEEEQDSQSYWLNYRN